MGTIIIDRLSKLGPQDCITAYCGNWRCEKHSSGVDLDIPALMARYGDLPLLGLGTRFRCQACGHRPAEIRMGWRLPSGTGRGWVNVSEG